MIKSIIKIFAPSVGTPSTHTRSTQRTRYPAKKGYRNDIPEVPYGFKSSMEANVYRFYRYISKKYKKIYKIEYEPERFVFKPNSFGIHSYIPDFKIYSGKNTWYLEVKGFLDDSDRQKARLMSENYPWIKLYYIYPKQYKLIKEYYGKMIPNWE